MNSTPLVSVAVPLRTVEFRQGTSQFVVHAGSHDAAASFNRGTDQDNVFARDIHVRKETGSWSLEKTLKWLRRERSAAWKG